MKFGRLAKFRYNASLEIVYVCPNQQCNETFIGYFISERNQLVLTTSRPVDVVAPPFEQSIRELSPYFCAIYTEANKAEQVGLLEICGVGYRKSVEFLIKDYLINLRPDDKASIEAMMLGACIEKFVVDPKIKEVAKRAAWLGNDETHYQRRWIDKDLKDLKLMIKLVLHWIEAELLTAEALTSMLAPTKP